MKYMVKYEYDPPITLSSLLIFLEKNIRAPEAMPKFAAVLLSSTYLYIMTTRDSRRVCFQNIFNSELVNISLNIYTCAGVYDQIYSCPCSLTRLNARLEL